ncbi:helix-turn-helix transcriptional regulator [Maledivibacter halophilus]|uniref:Putative transcriptional regulator n=1 Tax=Maledivibacter halophilus TaxID=36842 RepID=A0A1T5MGH7_9FIRM|nr:helix-turn-helix domain-containing protein [Maledivibacter halophilus]SKC86969.1 putative transcriptional regulator [Maledivibacter halophilus]
MRLNMIKRRKELGLTQNDVAKQINRSRNTYASYEIGTITPSLDVAIMIKRTLKTYKDDIFLNFKVTKNDINSA